MCRHLAYLGPPVSLARLVLTPAHGLYEQSWAPRRQTHGVVNADGFGLGWYPAGTEAGEVDGADDAAAQPARYRRAVPIWTDQNLPELARAIRSHAVIAAVRSATAGTGQEETAAAPFRDGRFLLSHNGAIPDWTRLPADLASAGGTRPDTDHGSDLDADSSPGSRLGTDTGSTLDPLDPADLLSLEARSDTALLWLLIYRELRRGVAPDRALTNVIRAVAEIRPTARLNLLLTDGKSIIATRYGDTLWYRTGPGSILVASEPDDEQPAAWREIPEDTLLLANAAGVVHTTPLRASYAAAEK
jgi:predicted glutamine amidotransferase